MIDHRLLTERLADAMATLTGKWVGRMEGPQTAVDGLDAELPYAFVEPLAGTQYIAERGGVWREAIVPYAFHSFGAIPQSALFMASLMHSRFVDQHLYTLTLSGFDVLERKPDGGPEDPEEVGVNLWGVREQFEIHICAQ